MENDNKAYEPGIYISLAEAEKQAAKHRGNPIIQQLVFLMRERETKRESIDQRLVDSAKHVIEGVAKMPYMDLARWEIHPDSVAEALEFLTVFYHGKKGA